MQKTLSGLGANWGGFRPVGYSFCEKALCLTLEEAKQNGNQRQRDISIATLLADHEGKEFQIKDLLTLVSITTDAESFELRGPVFHLQVAVAILALQQEGIKPFASEWFWLETSESNSDPAIFHSFFVVHEGKIVREEIRFMDSPKSGFDPAIFETEDDRSNPSWRARAAYWYRRFYQETKVGQFMALSPDLPRLHYYLEGRPWLLVRNVRNLLWAVIALLLLIVFLLIRK